MQTGTIILRAPEPSDLGVMYAFENNTDVWLYSETTRPFSKYTLEEYIKTAHDDIYTTKQLRFVIEKKERGMTPKAIGFVDLYDFDPTHKRAGVGILIGDENERRKGYAASSIQLLIHYAFQTLHLHQLYCLVQDSNHMSIALFEKSGFKQTAVFKDWLFNNGKWHPVIFMQLFSAIR